MTDDSTEFPTTPSPRRRLGLPGRPRPGEQLETVFRDDLPPAEDAPLPGYPLSRDQAAAAAEWLHPAAPGPRTPTDSPSQDEWVEPLADASPAALGSRTAVEAQTGLGGADEEWIEPLARVSEAVSEAVAAPEAPAEPAERVGDASPAALGSRAAVEAQAGLGGADEEWVEPLARVGEAVSDGLAAPAAPAAPAERVGDASPAALGSRAVVEAQAGLGGADEWVEPLARGTVAVEGPEASAEPEAAAPGVPAARRAPRRAGSAVDAEAPADEAAADPLAEIPLKAALEAVLMVVDEPTTAARLAEVLDRPKKLVAAALAELAEEYDAQQRGFELRFVAGGWRFYTRVVCAPVVDRFVLDGQQARLTQAALETLAVIAYRQPVSRSRVSAVRGVNCDGVMRTLVQRGLVEESGTEPETGAYLYRTTQYFLERMGLRGLDELPELAPFLPEADDVEADSQEGTAIAEAVAAAD